MGVSLCPAVGSAILAKAMGEDLGRWSGCRLCLSNGQRAITREMGGRGVSAGAFARDGYVAVAWRGLTPSRDSCC